MKRAFSILALSVALAFVSLAAQVDGRWVAKIEMKAPKKQGGGTRTVEIVFDLKAEGDKLTGTVSGMGGRRAQPLTIENGKIAGNKVSFTTTMKTRQGERKFLWEATVEGEDLKGARTPEGGRRSLDFTAHKQS